MADGSIKPVEEVAQEDKVASRSDATGANAAGRVVETYVRQAESLIELQFASAAGATPDTLLLTDDHPVYVEGRGWTKAKDVAAQVKAGVSTSIVSRAGPSVAVVGAEVIVGKRTVYNFQVEGTHSYFAGTTSGGLWVHNANYRVYFEFDLPLAERVGSRPRHFELSNQALGEALTGTSPDMNLLGRLQTVSPNILDEIGTLAERSPTNLTWHHATEQQAGRMGVMQLVDRWPHRYRFGYFHPGRSGGHREWGR